MHGVHKYKSNTSEENLTRRVTDRHTSLFSCENVMALAPSRRGQLGDTIHLNIIRY